MKKIIFILLVVIFLISCTKPRVDEDHGYLSNEISIKFKANVTKDVALGIIKQYDSKVVKESPDNWFRIQLPKGRNSSEMESTLRTLPEVQTVAPIREVQIVLK